MNELIKINTNENGVATVSSREVAEHFEKQHYHVLEAIDKLNMSIENSICLFIESIYPDSQGKKRREVLLTKDGFSLIAMGFTGAKAIEWKLKYIEAFNKMEQAWNNPEMVMSRALKLAEKQINGLQIMNNSLNKQIEKDKPKVLFANAVETSDTTILVGDLAKLIKQNGVDIGQKRLFDWLRNNDYLIKSGSSKNMPTQKSMEMGLFQVKERTISNPDGSVIITKTTKVSGKGQQYFISKFLEKDSA